MASTTQLFIDVYPFPADNFMEPIKFLIEGKYNRYPK